MKTRFSIAGFIIVAAAFLLSSCKDTILLAGLKDLVAAQLPWVRTFGGSSFDSPYAMTILANGNSVIAGSNGTGGTDGMMLAITPSGKVDWGKSYGGVLDDDLFGLAATADGGFVAGGRTRSFGAAGYDVWVVKADSKGSVQWFKHYGGAGFDTAHSIVALQDGSYLVVGYTTSAGAGNDDVWMLHLASDGSVFPTDYLAPYSDVGSHTYGTSSGNEDGFSAVQSVSTDYMVAGSWQSATIGGLLFLLATNRLMRFSNVYNVHNDTYDEILAVAEDKGGYIAVGDAGMFGPGHHGWILRVDGNGGVTWSKTIGVPGGAEQLNGACQTSDGGYLVAGYLTPSGGPGGTDAWVIKLSSNGTVQWQQYYGGSQNDQAFSARETEDGYIVAGSTSSAGAGSSDIWMLRIDKDGQPRVTSNGFVLGHDSGATVTNVAIDVAPLSGTWGQFAVTPTGLVSDLTIANWNPTVNTQYQGQ